MHSSSTQTDLLGTPQTPWKAIDGAILVGGIFVFLLFSYPFWINPEFRQGVDEGILKWRMIPECQLSRLLEGFGN